MPPEKTKTEAKPNAPTEAQLAKITGLADSLGVEAPVPTTADEATEMIEKLLELSAETPTEPEPTPDDGGEEADDEEEQAREEAQARSGAERSDKQTQQMFERAVNRFRDALRVVFEVDDLQPASAPGVIGFLLPGFTEQKTHDDFTRCATCNGYGNVLTGSMKEGDKERPCPDPRCKGRGYWERETVPPPPVVQPVSAVTGPTVIAPAGENGSQEWAEAPAWMGDPRLASGPTP